MLNKKKLLSILFLLIVCIVNEGSSGESQSSVHKKKQAILYKKEIIYMRILSGSVKPELYFGSISEKQGYLLFPKECFVYIEMFNKKAIIRECVDKNYEKWWRLNDFENGKNETLLNVFAYAQYLPDDGVKDQGDHDCVAASLTSVMKGVSLSRLKNEFSKYVYKDDEVVLKSSVHDKNYRECIDDSGRVYALYAWGQKCIDFVLPKFGYYAERIKTNNKEGDWDIEIPYTVSQKKNVFIAFACDKYVTPIPLNSKAFTGYHQVLFLGVVTIEDRDMAIYLDSNGSLEIVDYELLKSAYVQNSAYIVTKSIF